MPFRLKFFKILFFSWLILNLSLVNVPIYAENCCSQKNATKSLELPEATIQAVNINAGAGWGIFNGSIFNGNKNYHITQLIISMTPIHDHHHMKHHHEESIQPRIYTVNIELPPITKGALSIPLANEDLHVHNFDWKILKIFGYQID